MNNIRLRKNINFKGECNTSISIVRLFDLEIEKNGNGIRVTNYRTSQIVQIKDKEVELFLNQLQLKQPVTLPMSFVLATGGEAVIVINQKNPEEVIKAVPMKDDFKVKLDLDNLDFSNIKTTFDKERPRELTSNDLEHPKIIEFKDHAFQLIDGKLYHLTS